MSWFVFTQQGEELPANVAWDSIRFCAFGTEHATTTGRTHLQGFFQSIQRISLKQAIACSRFHYVSCMKGTVEASWCYITKECGAENVFMYGEPTESRMISSNQGSRSDLSNLRDLVLSGASFEECNELYPVQLSHSMTWFNRMLQEREREPRGEPTVGVYWGRTGTGKTRTVFDSFTDVYRVSPQERVKWFNGYRGQKVALFDDFSTSQMDISMFLQITDRYPLDLETKGGFIEWKPEVIIFTSNSNPRDWYYGDFRYPAVQRRIDTQLCTDDW